MPEPIGGVQPFAELARNGTTVVYKGYQRKHERFVLLKAVRSDIRGADLGDRLAAEAELAAQIRHPNVVAVYETGVDETTGYLVTEFVDGLDLRTLLLRGPLPVPLAVYVLREAAEGLRAVHASGILHRDLKPGNILLSSEGAVKLADFGLASLAPEAGDETRGTLAYLAPEVIRGATPTTSSDLFALGAVVAEALTGRPAFAGASPRATLDAVLHHDPTEHFSADPRVPTPLSVLVAGLLAKESAARPPSAMHLVGKLEALEDEVGRAGASDLAAFMLDPDAYVPPRSVPTPSLLPADARRSDQPAQKPRRRVWWAGALALLGLLGYGVVTGPGSATTDEQPPNPVQEGVQSPPASQRAQGVPSEEPRADSIEAEMPGAARERVAEVAAVNSDDSPEAVPPGELARSSDTEVEEGSRTPRVEEPLLERSGPDVAPARGQLSIAAEPWAEVQINGQLVGTTPLVGIDLPVGTHTVLLRNPEFPAHTLDIDLMESEETHVAVSLWDLVGRVRLTVSPWARVSVDGAYWDTVPPQDRPLILAPGTRRIEFVHPTLGTREVELAVAPGEDRSLRVDLRDRSP